MSGEWIEVLRENGVAHLDVVVPKILKALGREPNRLEAEIYGTMWSEHSGYNHSKPLLRLFDKLNAKLEVRP